MVAYWQREVEFGMHCTGITQTARLLVDGEIGQQVSMKVCLKQIINEETSTMLKMTVFRDTLAVMNIVYLCSVSTP